MEELGVDVLISAPQKAPPCLLCLDLLWLDLLWLDTLWLYLLCVDVPPPPPVTPPTHTSATNACHATSTRLQRTRVLHRGGRGLTLTLTLSLTLTRGGRAPRAPGWSCWASVGSRRRARPRAPLF
eukprot:scaffold40750_cov53-Phaeocystis_antarctica.AAC.4